LARERIETSVTRLANRLAAQLGYELVEVIYSKEGPDWILRCTIDTIAAGSVGINDCQRFSEALEKLLDQEDPIPGHYLLEVSSPGLERPLKTERDFERFAGRQIAIRLHQPLLGRKSFSGQLLGISGSAATAVIKIKSDDQLLEIPYSNLAKVNLAVELFGGEGGRRK
jgi:ribosome maturation factor RimP